MPDNLQRIGLKTIYDCRICSHFTSRTENCTQHRSSWATQPPRHGQPPGTPHDTENYLPSNREALHATARQDSQNQNRRLRNQVRLRPSRLGYFTFYKENQATKQARVLSTMCATTHARLPLFNLRVIFSDALTAFSSPRAHLFSSCSKNFVWPWLWPSPSARLLP